MIHLDTTFLVDLLREARRGPGPATAYLDAAEEQELAISIHALCELYAGAELSSNPSRVARNIREGSPIIREAAREGGGHPRLDWKGRYLESETADPFGGGAERDGDHRDLDGRLPHLDGSIPFEMAMAPIWIATVAIWMAMAPIWIGERPFGSGWPPSR